MSRAYKRPKAYANRKYKTFYNAQLTSSQYQSVIYAIKQLQSKGFELPEISSIKVIAPKSGTDAINQILNDERVRYKRYNEVSNKAMGVLFTLPGKEAYSYMQEQRKYQSTARLLGIKNPAEYSIEKLGSTRSMTSMSPVEREIEGLRILRSKKEKLKEGPKSFDIKRFDNAKENMKKSLDIINNKELRTIMKNKVQSLNKPQVENLFSKLNKLQTELLFDSEQEYAGEALETLEIVKKMGIDPNTSLGDQTIFEYLTEQNIYGENP